MYVIEENVSAKDLSIWRRLIFQQDNGPKHTAKTMKKTGLNPFEHLWYDLKTEVQELGVKNFISSHRQRKTKKRGKIYFIKMKENVKPSSLLNKLYILINEYILC